MPAIIPDEFLESANMTEREAIIEFACHLYDAQKIGKGLAARMVGLTRMEFEEELIKRGMPVIRYTEEMFKEDMETIEYLRKLRREGYDDRRK